MFLMAATESGSGITVNYTSSLVDSMIATKSDTSNVIKFQRLFKDKEIVNKRLNNKEK